MGINLIYGPPGTGKTTYLLNLLEGLLKKYAPEEIAFVSYTKKGSYEGRDRAIEKFNLNIKDLPYFRTLHSIAFKELGMRRYNMISSADYRTFSDKMGMKFSGYYTEDFRHDDDMYLFFDILHRNNPSVARKYLFDMEMNKLEMVQYNYKKFKQHMNIQDFTDLIQLYVEKNIKLPVKVAIIDEAQDLSTLQWKMIWTAFSNCDDIYVAGDDDQAIYEWAGSDINYFLNLKGKMTILNKSYRLPDNILEFSKGITEQISKRVDKRYSGTGKQGRIEFIAELEELEINPDESYMFLSRNNFYLTKVCRLLESRGVIYRKKGKPSYDHRELTAIRDYRLFAHSRDSKYLTTILQSKLKKEYNLNDPWYFSLIIDKRKIDYYNIIVENNISIEKCVIDVGTIHSVKGGEADNVVLMTDITKTVDKNLEENPDSEHRVFYVGVTRAKKNLFILNASSRREYTFYRRPRKCG